MNVILTSSGYSLNKVQNDESSCQTVIWCVCRAERCPVYGVFMAMDERLNETRRRYVLGFQRGFCYSDLIYKFFCF